MAQTFEQILTSINNTEIRMALEQLFAIVGAGTGSTVEGGIAQDVTGDVTGNVTGDVTGDLTGDVAGAVVASTLSTPTATPVNAVAATSVLTMADVGVEGDLLVIGADTYELDTDASVTEGNILVDISGGASKTQTVTALVAAQVASGTEALTFTDNADDTMGIASDTAGVIGNAIAFDDSNLNNGSINQNGGEDLLGGTVAGVDGTVGVAGEIRWDTNYVYVAKLANLISDANWERAPMSSYVGAESNSIISDLVGDVTGDLTGDVTGDLTGDVTGNLTGSASVDSKNIITNGDFNIWQRGTSFAAIVIGAVAADMFSHVEVGDSVHTVTRDTDVPTLSESGHQSSYSYKLDCTTVDADTTANDLAGIQYKVEGYDFAPLQGKTATLSFWVKGTKTGTHTVAFKNIDTSDRSYIAEYTIDVTDTWEKKEITLTFDSSGGTWDYTTGQGLQIHWTVMSGPSIETTAGAWQTGNYYSSGNQVNACDSTDNNFFLSQVQLEIGDVATPFMSPKFSDELVACERYFRKTYNVNVDPGTGTIEGAQTTNFSGLTSADFTATLSHSFRVPMRAAPTVVAYDLAGASGKVTMPSGDGLTGTISSIGTNGFLVSGTNGEASVNRSIAFQATAEAKL